MSGARQTSYAPTRREENGARWVVRQSAPQVAPAEKPVDCGVATGVAHSPEHDGRKAGRLLPNDAPAWAEQLARLVASAQPSGGLRPVLTLQEGMDLTGCSSSSAFYRWLNTWAPRACCSHGRYTRAALCRGLDQEAMHTRRRRIVRTAADEP